LTGHFPLHDLVFEADATVDFRSLFTYFAADAGRKLGVLN